MPKRQFFGSLAVTPHWHNPTPQLLIHPNRKTSLRHFRTRKYFRGNIRRFLLIGCHTVHEPAGDTSIPHKKSRSGGRASRASGRSRLLCFSCANLTITCNKSLRRRPVNPLFCCCVLSPNAIAQTGNRQSRLFCAKLCLIAKCFYA